MPSIAGACPLCPPLPITGIEAAVEVHDRGVRIEVTARVTGKTGVEMEAMTRAAIAGLTIVDMVKGIERRVSLGHVRLLSKSPVAGAVSLCASRAGRVAYVARFSLSGAS